MSSGEVQAVKQAEGNEEGTSSQKPKVDQIACASSASDMLPSRGSQGSC